MHGMMLGYYREFVKRDENVVSLLQGYRMSEGGVTGVGTLVTPELLKTLTVDYQPPRRM